VTPSLIYRWRRDLRTTANGFAQVLVAAGDGVAIPPVSAIAYQPNLPLFRKAALTGRVLRKGRPAIFRFIAGAGRSELAAASLIPAWDGAGCAMAPAMEIELAGKARGTPPAKAVLHLSV
jgi:hypothetical protein